MSQERHEAELDGIFVPVFTPFTPDGADVNEEQLRHNVRFLVERGIRILNPAGTTGEFWTLTIQEHRRVLRTVIQEAKALDPGVIIAAGISSPNLAQTLELAAFASGCGADLLQLAPTFYFPMPEDDLVSYYQSVSSAVNVPVMIYEIPAATGVQFNCDLLERICELCPNVTALKTASPMTAPWEFERIVRRFGGRLSVFAATGAYFSPFTYMTGIAGITDTMANVAPEFGLTLHRLARSKRWSEMLDVYHGAFDVLEIEMLYGRAALKEIANVCGLKVGPTRHPMVSNVTPSIREDIARRLAGWRYTNKLVTQAQAVFS